MALAYAESYTLVRYLHELQPGGGLAGFLRNLALTGDVDRALLRAYREPADRLQTQWLTQVRQDYLKHGLDPVVPSLIFGLSALLFVVVYAASLRRRRRIRERLQEEERLRRMLGYEVGESDAVEDAYDQDDF